MNTTTSQQHAPPRLATPARVAQRRRRPESPDSPTWGELFDETAALSRAPAFFGPPVIYLLGPWLLLVLLLSGPFALALTLVVVLAVAASLLAMFVAVIASPYLLIRHLRGHGVAHARPRFASHLFRRHRVSPGRLGSPQPKGVS
jgi:hypothetical protein